MPPAFMTLQPRQTRPERRLSRLLKGGVKFGSGKPQNSRAPGDDDEDAEVDKDFTPDATFDFMSQLKDVLMISVLRGWQIFDEGYVLYASCVCYAKMYVGAQMSKLNGSTVEKALRRFGGQ